MSLRKVFCLFLFSTFIEPLANAQTSSYGPGKASPTRSKYTYPQPPKRTTTTAPERIQPGFEVPDNPEKYTWKLSTKHLGPDAKSTDIPVYYFDPDTDQRISVGSAPVGQEIMLEEVRGGGDSIYYKIQWTGTPKTSVYIGKDPQFWVDGSFIEYAGKK